MYENDIETSIISFSLLNNQDMYENDMYVYKIPSHIILSTLIILGSTPKQVVCLSNPTTIDEF